MKNTNLFRKLALAGLTAGLLSAGIAQAAVSYFESGDPVSIPGLTNFSTTGAMMDGMTVTATFSDQTSETLIWRHTIGGVDSGGVTASRWSLGLSGDSYEEYWNFSFGTSGLALLSLKLDGSTGLTVFDRTFDDSEGTLGSALGWDFQFTGTPDVSVTYLNPVKIGSEHAVNDIFHQVLIEFDGGIRTNFSFGQDTDNDSRLDIPEPASLALFGLGLLGLGFSRRRKY